MSIKGFQTDISMLELNDVDVSGSPGLVTGDALIYNASTQKFQHVPTPEFSGIDALADVTLTPIVGSPLTHAENELLSYDTGTDQWINKTPPAAGVQALSTGSFDGGEIQFGTLSGSPLSTALFTVTAGSGIIVDNHTDPEHPVFARLSWTEFTDQTLDALLTHAITYIAIDENGNIVQSTSPYSPEEHRDYIVLGRVGHVDNATVAAVRSNAHGVFDTSARLGDLAEAIGSFNVNGNLYSNPNSNLTIDKSEGQSYRLGNNFQTSKKSPDITVDAADAVATFKYSYQDTTPPNFIVTADTITIDPGNYDDGSGTLATMPANDWQVQVIKFFPGPTPIHRIEYGQTKYGTKDAAIAGIPDINHDHNPIFAEGIVRSYLVLKGDATDLNDLADAEFLEAGRFGSSGAVGSTVPSVFTSSFESAELGNPIVVNTDYSVAHGLGAKPSGMQAFLICKTAELGYATGDETEFLNGDSGSPTTMHYKGLYSNNTADEIGWHTGGAVTITSRIDGTAANVTLANWAIILRAYV